MVQQTDPMKTKKAKPSQIAVNGDIFSDIATLEPTLSRAHRTIAQKLLASPQEFIEKPIEDLASWIGVSAPTITRFARATGCDGLRELKLKVMGGLRVGLRYLEPLTPPDGTTEVVSRVVRRAHHAMATAVQTLNVQKLEQTAGLIGGARTLYAFGSGGVSSWLIEELQNRLFRLGIPVVPCADHLTQMMLAATVKPRDVVLCCSLTGRNAELLKVSGIARGYGAKTLALTAQDSPLAGAVDLALTVALNDDGDVLGPTSMRYGYLVVIDALAYAAGLRNARPAQECLRRIKRQFVIYRDADDSAPLCD